MTVAEGTDRYIGVVFDMDGVLVESEHLWEENWVSFAADHGYTWTAEDTARCQGMSVPEWASYLGGKSEVDDWSLVADAVIAGMIGHLHAGNIVLLPGSEAMVRETAARVPIAVASSAPRRLIEAVLNETNLMSVFSAFVSSEEVPRGKPSPDVYEEAARRLGLDPTRCAGVEDSSNGLRAAAAAGMTVIAIPNPVYPPKQDALALASRIATSPDDARRILLERLPEPR